jgi:hypothetical protein
VALAVCVAECRGGGLYNGQDGSGVSAVWGAAAAKRPQSASLKTPHVYTCLLWKMKRADCHIGRGVWWVLPAASVAQMVRTAGGPLEHGKSVLQQQQTRSNIDKAVDICELADVRLSATSATLSASQTNCPAGATTTIG